MRRTGTAMPRELPDLTHLAGAGADIGVRVTPGSSRDRIELGEPLRVHVTAPAEHGKANAAAMVLLARALGVPKSRLVLLRGQRSRNKVVRVRQG